MKAINWVISLWVSIIAYTLLSLFVGARGLSAYNQLKKERDAQAMNLDNLKTINQRLEGDKDALLYDSDAIIVYARDLGYGAENERLVRIVGLSGMGTHRYAAGQVIVPAKQQHLSNQAIRIISLFIGVGSLAFLFFSNLLWEAGEKPQKTDSV